MKPAELKRLANNLKDWLQPGNKLSMQYPFKWITFEIRAIVDDKYIVTRYKSDKHLGEWAYKIELDYFFILLYKDKRLKLVKRAKK